MMKVTTVNTISDYRAVLEDSEQIRTIADNIRCGAVYLAKNVIDAEYIERVKNYLAEVGRGSLPNYHPIAVGAPNFHRINDWDERAYVKGCFHQFAFFPWNQDLFRFYETMRPVFYLKNQINGLPREKYLGDAPEDGCIARLSFQFYPSGGGGLNKHSDPVDYHQLTVPTLVMSKRGVDYQTGGTFAVGSDDQEIFFEDEAEIGDVVFFNAQIPHGVKTIDADKPLEWEAFQGRWMMIFATNKLGENKSVQDAVDLEANE